MPDPCLVKPRKPILPVKTLDVLFRRRYVPNTQFYFTNRRHALPKSGEMPKKVKSFRVPRSQHLLSYIKYSDRKEKAISKHRMSQPLHLKDNLRIAATRDLSQRLFITEVPDDVKAVVALHPEFYTVIEGRPLRSFDDVKVYMNNIRGYAMLRQQIGYRRDLMLKLERNVGDEIKEYQNVSDNLRLHIKNFQKFLTEDYKKACVKAEKAEKIYQDLQAQISDYIGQIMQMTLLNNMIFKLDAIRNVLKTYRTYALFSAPLYWRYEYDETYRPVSVQYEEGEFLTHSGEFFTDTNDLVETLDIDNIIENALVELKNPPKPHLYWQNPEEMVYLFRTMELQSREYLIQLSKTQAPYTMLQKQIKRLKDSTQKELDFSQYYINSLEKEIEREMFNEIYLQKKFMRILNETFFDTIASPETLKLKICIEFVYEQVFGKSEEGHFNLFDPMKTIEVAYEDYSLRLDSLDFKIVKEATRDFFEQDRIMMKNAYHAQRELREFNVMTTAMNKAFLPPAQFKRPELKKFMDKKALRAARIAEARAKELASGVRVQRKKYRVSAEDRDDLLLFTEWCEGLNPAPFLKEIEAYVRPAFKIVPKSND